MEESKASIAKSAGSLVDKMDIDTVEARFTDLCKKGLSLDENGYSDAMKLFRETKHLISVNVSIIGGGTLEEAERFWFAFVLYATKRLTERTAEIVQQGDKKFTLCLILRAAKLNIVDFFKELPQFLVKSGPVLSKMYGEDWENKLEAKELQTDFVHLSLLSK